ncbi:hypothetical protein TNCV_5090521 [Trichonephila clavipes]|nr:hypothetical protein TNCV_5090521 [Trichonephila clavipes]
MLVIVHYSPNSVVCEGGDYICPVRRFPTDFSLPSLRSRDGSGRSLYLRVRSGSWAEHEDSPRQDKIICSMQTLPRSSTHAQSHLGMPNRRNKVTKNGNGPSEELFAGTPVQRAEAVIKTFDGI